jgi:hypothetical protein
MATFENTTFWKMDLFIFSGERRQIPTLSVLVIRKEKTLAMEVYTKPTNIRRYLNFNSNHPPHVKLGLILSLQKSSHQMPRTTRSVQ